MHYPEQILRFGPLIHSWTLCHEAKLKLHKQVAKFGNFKNVCFSVALKHERWLCYQLQSSLYLTDDLVIGGLCKSVSAAAEPVYISQNLTERGISLSSDALMSHPSWVKYLNSTFKVNGVIVVNTSHYPLFGKIKGIIVLPDNFVFFFMLPT